MRGTTIDQLDIKEHVRWAQDQLDLDTTYVKESHFVPLHSELFATSAIYASQWESLFEVQRGNTPWANFSPPKRFHLQTKRFFSYRIFPYLHWDEHKEGEEKENREHLDLFERIAQAVPAKKQARSSVEQDRGALLQLLETIKSLNTLLSQINARKLQYQRG
jgi:hypothetical protein